MSSGVKVDATCAAEFEKMKMHHEYSYIIFKITQQETKISVDKTAPKGTPYEDLVADLSAAADNKECRYAAFDLDFTFNDKPKNKIVFIAWSPEGAKIKQKMIYTSSKDYLKKQLQLVIELQATDMEELGVANLIERAQRGMKD
ncbi:actophorin-like [Watersipora subatra]|uniref:actophorin-like n=1 Tax=Watersipora subatra TaxID=2589382 RepID=UPI00355B542A